MILFNYNVNDEIRVFKDGIFENSPCIFKIPRNHESLFFVTEGSLMYEKNGKGQIVKKGQVGYVARGSIDKSSAYMCHKVSYIAVNFSFDKLSSHPDRTLPFDTVCADAAFEYKALFVKLYEAFVLNSPSRKLLTRAVLLEIIAMLYNQFTLGSTTSVYPYKIKMAIDCIANRYDDPDLRIFELAELCNMSERSLRRRFLEIYQKTPFEYLQDFRIRQAKILLEETQKPISEIATLCGFSNMYVFSHCFKSHSGTSPSGYRKMIVQ